MKKIVLELLKLSKDANSEMGTYRLEKLLNLKSNEEIIFGRKLILFLDSLQKDGLINTNENKSIYSITQKGLEYLKQHSEK
jgi:predicted transcriptional regulator